MWTYCRVHMPAHEYHGTQLSSLQARTSLARVMMAQEYYVIMLFRYATTAAAGSVPSPYFSTIAFVLLLLPASPIT